MKKIVLIDLDRTLIDTNKIHKDRLAIRKKQFTHKETERALDKLQISPRYYNFEGIENFLEQLRRRYILILFSYGKRPYQMSKLRQSRLGRFFTKTVITSNLHKKKDLIFFRKKYGEDILLIDDSREVAATARALGIKVIRIRRGIKGPVYYKKLLTKILKSYEVGNR